jgi:hypothetical protein
MNRVAVVRELVKIAKELVAAGKFKPDDIVYHRKVSGGIEVARVIKESPSTPGIFDVERPDGDSQYAELDSWVLAKKRVIASLVKKMEANLKKPMFVMKLRGGSGNYERRIEKLKEWEKLCPE